VIRRVLVKNENGAFFGFADVTQERIAEGITPLSPDDLVDGKKVKDWPVGVHKIRTVEFANGERVTDWSADTSEDSNGEA
jgi:hypothetical protein